MAHDQYLPVSEGKKKKKGLLTMSRKMKLTKFPVALVTI